MVNFNQKNNDGDKIHRVLRSTQFKPEIIKLQKKSKSRIGVKSPLFLFYGLLFLMRRS